MWDRVNMQRTGGALSGRGKYDNGTEQVLHPGHPRYQQQYGGLHEESCE